MFLLFVIFVAVVAAVLLPYCCYIIAVLCLVLFWYPFWLRFPWFWGNWCKFFELLREGLYDWKEVLDAENSPLFAVTFIFFFGKLSPERNSESAGTFFSMRSIDCLYSMQYDHAYFAQGQYSLDWVVLVNLCNHEPLCLSFFFGW